MKVETKKVRLSEINPNPDNPRQITKAQLDRLVKSITEFPEANVWSDLPLVEWGLDLPEDWLGGGKTEGLTDPDEVPEPPKVAITKPGDIWLCGKHRVCCGNSTKAEDVERLMDGVKADMVFTDPPYGKEVVQSNQVGGGGPTKFGKIGGRNIVPSSTYKKIEGDDTTDSARDFYLCCIAQGIKNLFFWGGNYFTDFLPPSPCWVIWDKENTGNFADVEMAWTSMDKGAKLYRWLWNGLSRKGARKEELTSRVHPTQKPVGLFVEIFKDFPFEVCLDGFGGSGSTLIAAEQTGRTAYLMEIDCLYVQVILERWMSFTGEQAVLEITGQTFEQVKRGDDDGNV